MSFDSAWHFGKPIFQFPGRRQLSARVPGWFHKTPPECILREEGWVSSNCAKPIRRTRNHESDWFLKGPKFDKILGWLSDNGYNRYFDYGYLKDHVNSDLQAAQIVSDIRPKSKDVEAAYYQAKTYYNAFGSDRSKSVFDQVVNKVDAWMKDNKVETL